MSPVVAIRTPGGAGDREGRPYGEAGTGGVEPRPPLCSQLLLDCLQKQQEQSQRRHNHSKYGKQFADTQQCTPSYYKA